TAGSGIACGLCEVCDSTQDPPCVQKARKNCDDDPLNPKCCKLTTVPGQAKLQIKDRTPDQADLVSFKWNKGAKTDLTEFGSPTTTDGYALCFFNPGLVLQLDAPAKPGNVCGTSQCWKQLGIKGFSYKDPTHTPNGVDKVVLKAGVAGK